MTLQNPPSQKALSIIDLTVSYHRHLALSNIHLQVPKGILVGIIGPNGAGKSTLVKAALNLIPRQSGKVEFLGQPIDKIQNQIGYVPQRESVDWDFPLTVQDLVLMGRYGKIGLCRRPGKIDYEIAHECLEQVDLTSLAHRQIGELSCGQQQRAFIARALAQEASIYFMDEPFAGIDITTEKLLVDLLKQMTRNQQKTLFVVHHDLHNLAEHYDWIIMLNTELVAAGEVHAVFTSENIAKTFKSRDFYV